MWLNREKKSSAYYTTLHSLARALITATRPRPRAGNQRTVYTPHAPPLTPLARLNYMRSAPLRSRQRYVSHGHFSPPPACVHARLPPLRRADSASHINMQSTS
eukprot:TRINITY_DN23098_c0_g1_i1.p1 TRINITY_DN23098_c0_g1~~TRINITY_DN23098_c0_g1_i1.p1  ORF type:complete len:103 (-),score=4.35 TRINITY_DN23098_c0_g1_i1:196-504(-)